MRRRCDPLTTRVLWWARLRARVSNASGGIITVAMTASVTAAIEEGIYVYDLEITSGAGIVTRLLQGEVTVNPEVTR